MSALKALSACAGSWRGTNRLHDPHTRVPEDSPSTLSVTPILGGRFVRLDSTWGCHGAPQEGSLLIGEDAKVGLVTAHWIDTWHMSDKAMACAGAVEAEGKISLRGSYGAPPGPDWGWRIELFPVDGSALRLFMFNIPPDGREELAVEAAYARATAAEAGAGLRVAEIGQIAVTVRDVAAALHFYRDVLGLRFLFSPGPQLAFLAAGSVRIMLSTPQGAGAAGANSILYFKVQGLEAVHQAILARGAANERAPQLTAKLPDHELWIAFVRDPDGNLVGLMEERR